MKRYIKSSYPDFSAIQEAQQFLDSQDPAKVELVEDCYDEVLEAYECSDLEDFCPHTKEIMRDFRSEAAEEWVELSVDEADKLFNEIYQAIETVRADEAAAWC